MGIFPQIGVKIKKFWNHHLASTYASHILRKSVNEPTALLPGDAPRKQIIRLLDFWNPRIGPWDPMLLVYLSILPFI